MVEFRELTGAPDGRRYAAGAELVDGGVSFRVWAPERKTVWVVLEGGGEHRLTPERDGYHSGVVPDVAAGALYRLRLDGVDELLPDPASRWQPEGPRGPSEVVSGSTFHWTHTDWPGLRQKGQIIYEMHVGTFSAAGTYAGALEQLPKLSEIGVTTLELLPLNEFNGGFGWGYDGILLYAPYHPYGTPDELRHLIDTAHGLGMGVILDVVYNHFGPGDKFELFSPHYFRDGPANEWGKSVSFDRRKSLGAREYVVDNTLYWIAEFGFDGFRLDATQAIEDDSDEHVLAEIARKARLAAGERSIVIMGENEPQDPKLARSVERGGYGLDGIWNEDFHHSATAAVTLSNEGYLHDQFGTPQELVSMAKYGFLFQGQRYDWQDDFRGKPARDLRPEQFVHYLQNHDQIANSAIGRRLWQRISPGRARVITAYQLLMPQTPILFQGQEFAASTPFFYFLDSDPELHEQVKAGRIDFLQQFPGARDTELQKLLPDPSDHEAFERSKLDWREWETHGDAVALHRDLIRMRQTELAFARQPHGASGEIEGAAIGPDAFLLHYYADDSEDERLVVFNLGRDLAIRSIPDPAAAPPEGSEWSLRWSSSDARYGGEGIWPADLAERWTLRAETALVFGPVKRRSREFMGTDALKTYQRTLF